MTQVSAARAPYALEPTVFPFPHLAALAGRAGMGGPRETALACLVVARLVTDCGSNGLLTPEQRLARAQATRTWLSAATVPAAIRAALARLAEATGEHPAAVAAALESVIAVTANLLDQGARSELSKLTQAVAG